MDYELHYEKLITRGNTRKLVCYTEAHHIVPKCLGGLDIKSNLVDLTGREHFVAHLLLVKIYPKEYGLIKALNMMCVSSDNQERIGNRMYSWIKEKFSESMSISQSGEGNSQFGKMWISNLEFKETKKIYTSEDIPKSWIVGRNVWNKIERMNKEKKQREDDKRRKQEEKNRSCVCPICENLFDGKLKYCNPNCKAEAKQLFVNSDKFVSNKGFKHTEETKKIISEKMKRCIRS